MRTLILEDEPVAAEHLQSLLRQAAPELVVLDTLPSVSKAQTWLAANPAPDLMFCDIHLQDGYVFELFTQQPVECPIIFTTAYDQYALQAFEVNSMGYLLKPIHPDALGKALHKWRRNTLAPTSPQAIAQVWQSLQLQQPRYKVRFLVKRGQRHLSLAVASIAYFLSEDQLTYLVTHAGDRFVLGTPLDELETQVDPQRFFRLNRQALATYEAITEFSPFMHGRLSVALKPPTPEPLLVSKNRAPAFKAWMDR